MVCASKASGFWVGVETGVGTGGQDMLNGSVRCLDGPGWTWGPLAGRSVRGGATWECGGWVGGGWSVVFLNYGFPFAMGAVIAVAGGLSVFGF